MTNRKAIKIFVAVESLLLLAAFLDSINEKKSFIYLILGRALNNAMTLNLFLASFILLIYGIWQILRHKEWRDPINYLAIFLSCLYLYLIYVELVIEKAF